MATRARKDKQRPRKEPIAIVGIGCRFPGGANDPETYWRLLREGVDAISDVPSDRWDPKAYWDAEPGTPGKTNSRRGGFLENIDRFDAAYFGISPREAARMDPQQRMLLEVAAEALEDSGGGADRLTGSETAVFIGMSAQDYTVLQYGSNDQSTIDAHTNTGAAMSIAANRISYYFDFHGPSLSLDTACSSSLVAVHLACQSLWNEEATAALAGGVNVLIKPDPFIGFTRLSMLSPDGRCKAFDASANGFVRAEGVGVIVLKPLSSAVADGDRIYATILGTGSNQDGRTTSMTVPSRDAQEALLARTCREAGVDPAQIQYMEAHGTGTLVGDPIEASALGRVLGRGRPEGSYCAVGSVKTNIGHLEPAAGIAGLIKVALSLKNGQIPGNLHFHDPNPDIPLDQLRLRVQQGLAPFPRNGAPARAGVNSFGFGGTNAHVLLEESPVASAAEQPDAAASPVSCAAPRIVPLSAASQEALRATAERFVDVLDPSSEQPLRFEDVCWSTALRRTHREQRLAIVARDADQMRDALAGFLADEPRPTLVVGERPATGARRIAFVCSGQGPQWWAMGRELYEQEPRFREVVDRADEIVKTLGDWSLVEELLRDEDTSRMQETAIAQPSIFATQVALAALWRSWGVEPDVLVGHSVGEVAAAHLAGALGFDDAVRVIYHRGRCMDFAEAHGKMLAVGVSEDDARELIGDRTDRVSVAALNSPGSVTLSGDASTLEEIAAELEGGNTFHKFLRVNYAFHSPLMDPMREELLSALADVTPKEAELPLYSTVTGTRARGDEFDGDYWWQNVRKAVRFAGAVKGLLEEGYDLFLELSPHPVLSSAVKECAGASSHEVTALHSLRRGDDERHTMLRALGSLYTVGAPIDWSAVVPPDGKFVRLPAYPWQRERYWNETQREQSLRLGTEVHPLLGRRLEAAEPTWQKRVDPRVERYLADHCVQGHAVFPAVGYIEQAVAAAGEIHDDGPYIVEDVELAKACFLADNAWTMMQVRADLGDSTFRIHSRTPSDETWTEHASGRVLAYRPDDGATAADIDEIRRRCPVEMAGEDCYAMLGASGLDYGPAFQGVEKIWTGEREALGRIHKTEGSGSHDGYHLHPTLFDACLQVMVCTFPTNDQGATGLFLPVGFRQVRVFEGTPETAWAHVRIRERTSRHVLADVRVLDDAGRIVVDALGVRCQAVEAGAVDELDELIYEYCWEPALPLQVGAGAANARLPTPESLIETVTPAVARLASSVDHGTFEADLDRLATRVVVQALARDDVELRAGDRFTSDALAERLAVVPGARKELERVLRLLEQDGALKAEGDSYTVVGEREEGAAVDWRALFGQYPDGSAELTMVERYGRRLNEILRGEVSASHAVFPEGSDAIADHYYQDSPSMAAHNQLCAEVVKAATEAATGGRKLHILELDAGTGGMTAHVLGGLDPARTRYVFCDRDDGVFRRAEEKFRDHPFVDYLQLDPTGDLAELTDRDDPIERHSFDLILATGVLDARDRDRVLENVKHLLGSEGLLISLEAVHPVRWRDLVVGSEPAGGFDARREGLEQAGFREVRNAWAASSVTGHTLIVARGPRIEAAHDDESEAGTAVPADGRWLLFADRAGTAERIAARLRHLGGEPIFVYAGNGYEKSEDGTFRVDPADADQMRTLLREASANGYRAIVHCWNADAPDAGSASSGSDADVAAVAAVAAVDDAMIAGSFSVVSLAQAVTDVYLSDPPRMWVVTCGAESVGRRDEATSPVQGAAWGLNRVIATEVPKLRASVVDLGSHADIAGSEIDGLCAEMLADGAEDEIALRGDVRYVHRFRRTGLDDGAGTHRSVVPGQGDGFRLETAGGVFDKLSLRTAERRAPGPGEVEISVRAAGLNFSDVMKALGLYPGLGDGAVPLGIECSGVVSAVGAGVDRLQPGDAVLATTPFSFGSYVTVPEDYVMPMPSAMTFDEAATIPIAFLTAHYAMNYLGRMAAGERVLIHSATGGVGLAAIQLAMRAGAEVFATAGTPEKRNLLRALGVEHVMDSRSLAFADQILEATDGEGVDLVLNSLPGDAIRKGLEVLRDDGRFLEIGKRDIYGNSRLGMRPFQRNLSFMGIDLDRELRKRPTLISRLFRELMDEFEAGHLRPLAHRVFPVTNAVGSFRHMAQARHVGKVVISLDVPEVVVAPSSDRSVEFAADASYLLTGGCGGFGLVIARWMVEHGARNLVLMGRSGAQSEEAQQCVSELQAAGARVEIARADAGDVGQVRKVLADIDAGMPPLRGVLHAAMVLDDVVLHGLTEEQMRRVWGPKARGAWILHQETSERELDFFVLFSSMSAVLGAGGQANYAAANAFLDSLAHLRHARGLPATSVSWGFLGEVGVAARQGNVAERFRAMGIESFTPTQAMTVLGHFVRRGRTRPGVMRVNWRRWGELAASTMPPRFAELVAESAGEQDEGAKKSGAAMRAKLLAADPDDRRALIEPLIREHVARVLGAAPGSLDFDKPLSDLGLDSLMAVELRNWIEGDLGLSLPSVELLRGPSMAQLSEVLLDRLVAIEGSDGATEPDSIPRSASADDDARKAEEMLDRLDEMSDEEVESLLGETTAEAGEATSA